MGCDHIVWGDSDLTIPEENYGEALEELRKITPSSIFELNVEKSVAQQIIDLLNIQGYEAEKEPSLIRITDDPKDDIDIPDETLEALTGIVTPGSYITYFDIGGNYWQLRYTECFAHMKPGRIIFDDDDRYPYKTECRADD